MVEVFVTLKVISSCSKWIEWIGTYNKEVFGVVNLVKVVVSSQALRKKIGETDPSVFRVEVTVTWDVFETFWEG